MLKIYLSAVRSVWPLREQIADDVLYEAEYMRRFAPGEWIQPTRAGARLYALREALFSAPIAAVKQARCDHPRMIDKSHAGPDSGYDAGECPDCGFTYHVSMY